MRPLLVAIAALTISIPASAARVDPQAIVLRQAEMPSGFVVDRQESRATPNEIYVSPAGLRKLVERSGRIEGYRRVFRHRSSNVKVVQAGVDLFRRPPGSQSMLAWYDAEQRRQNERRGVINAYGREHVGIGAKSWVYWSGYPGYFVLLVWRHDRLLGVVASWKVGREGTLALACAQQRRMAAALR